MIVSYDVWHQISVLWVQIMRKRHKTRASSTKYAISEFQAAIFQNGHNFEY